MDTITKIIIFDLIKSGHSTDMISAELGISPHDIKTALQSAERNQATNILT
jgi:DNA-binding CsgD family transcriptional regulator